MTFKVFPNYPTPFSTRPFADKGTKEKKDSTYKQAFLTRRFTVIRHVSACCSKKSKWMRYFFFFFCLHKYKLSLSGWSADIGLSWWGSVGSEKHTQSIVMEGKMAIEKEDDPLTSSDDQHITLCHTSELAEFSPVLLLVLNSNTS